MNDYSTNQEEEDKILNRNEFKRIGPLLHSEKLSKPKYIPNDLDYTNIEYKQMQENLDTQGKIILDNSGNLFNIRIDEDTIQKVIDASLWVLLVWILAIYFIVFYILGFFMKQGEETYLDYTYSYFAGKTIIDKTLVGIFDFLMFLTIGLGLVHMYVTASVDTRMNIVPFLWEWSWEYFDENANFFGLLLFTFGFYVLVYLLNIPMTQEVRSYFVHLIDVKIWSLIAFFFIIELIRLLFGIDIPAYMLGKNWITDLWTLPTKEPTKTQTTIPLTTSFSGNNLTIGNTIANNISITTPPSATSSSTASFSIPEDLVGEIKNFLQRFNQDSNTGLNTGSDGLNTGSEGGGDRGFNTGDREDRGFNTGDREDRGFHQGGSGGGFNGGGRDDGGFNGGGRDDGGFHQEGNVYIDPKTKNEVFNIGNNLYNYDDAQMICTSYGARLATYDEIEDSYNNGAEWCNYGWSDGQMIFFPTQKSTWDNLQKGSNPKRKNMCGRPGVNGGYMENPHLRFGVNCYGKRPTPKPEDLERMNNGILPKTLEDLELEKKVNFWKENSDKLLKINAFSKNNWSQF
jgi:uncharacterized membrane protein YgcG